jgi:hypothetical protein
MTAKQYDPDKTKGARAARKTREKLNSATDKERERLLQVGMALIYGGEKVRCSRH